MFDYASTEVLSVPDFFKATPAEEGGERFVYLEASNEARDLQGEVVLAKALEASADYFARYGNFDLDHKTQIKGVPDGYLFEIGRPTEVKVSRGKTWVKGSIYRGETAVAKHANDFWDSLTKIRPAKRWYPSVGGAVLDKGPEFDPATRSTGVVVRAVRWTNIGFSATPVNSAVAQVSVQPIGALAKALTAGYGTDSATLSGGGALRQQSLDHGVHSYWDFRDAIAGDLRKLRTKGSAATLVDHAHRTYGLEKALAAEWTEHFLADLAAGLNSKKGTIQ